MASRTRAPSKSLASDRKIRSYLTAPVFLHGGSATITRSDGSTTSWKAPAATAITSNVSVLLSLESGCDTPISPFGPSRRRKGDCMALFAWSRSETTTGINLRRWWLKRGHDRRATPLS